MSRGMKLGLVGGTLVAAVVAIVMLSAAKKRGAATEVKIEQVARRDLVASVTASGKIEAETSVDISTDLPSPGRIVKLGVREGDVVRKGQFLIQIDPTQFQAAVARAEALVSSGRAMTLEAKANRDQSERALTRARGLAQSGSNLISPEAVEQAETGLEVAEATYRSSRAQVEQAEAGLREARDNLNKTRLISPINGRVVRLAVEEGEVAVPGTFSRETGLLMTVADLSVILAKVKVDETDVVRLTPGDSVEVTIDAFPDTTFIGKVTKISNSATLTATQTAGGSSDRAVDFDVEVTLTDPPDDIRPDLSSTARVVTETRAKVLSVPIIALTTREHEVVPNETKGAAEVTPASTGAAQADTGKAKKKEREGVFVVRDGVATFRPVKIGITGEEHFEIVDGVREGEEIVAGTYQAIRDLKDGTKVKPAPAPAPGQTSNGKDAKPS